MMYSHFYVPSIQMVYDALSHCPLRPVISAFPTASSVVLHHEFNTGTAPLAC
jgi:hypothetical protein